MGFSEKKWRFFKITNDGKFSVERVWNDIFKCLFHFNWEFFWQKNQRIFNLGKLENMMKSSFKKKRFHPFERQLFQNWKAENMLVVAGHFVSKSAKTFVKRNAKNIFRGNLR